MKISARLIAIANIFMIALCAKLPAQDVEMTPHIYAYPGIFLPNTTTEIRVDDPGTGIGTTLQLEKELGFNSHPSVFSMQVVAGNSAQFAVSYMQLNRSGSALLSRNIQFGDTVYTAGALTDAYFNSQIFSGAFRFAIISRPAFKVGLSAGLKWIDVKTGIRVSYIDYQYNREESLGLPIPFLGVHGDVYLLPRLHAIGVMEYFHLNTSGYEGTVIDFNYALEYYFLKNAGAGISYSLIRYEAAKFPFQKDFSGMISYSLNGFSFFAAIRF